MIPACVAFRECGGERRPRVDCGSIDSADERRWQQTDAKPEAHVPQRYFPAWDKSQTLFILESLQLVLMGL